MSIISVAESIPQTAPLDIYGHECGSLYTVPTCIPYIYCIQAIFTQVEFKQVNLANPASAEKAFASDDGPFDFVYNLAAETKYSQSEEV